MVLEGSTASELTEVVDGSELEVHRTRGAPYLSLGTELTGFDEVVWISSSLMGPDGDVQAEEVWHVMMVGTDQPGLRRVWGLRLWLPDAEPCRDGQCTLQLDVDDDAGVDESTAVSVFVHDRSADDGP